MNEFDQFVKHTLRVKHYFRYTDDFIVVDRDEEYLIGLISLMRKFLYDRLALRLHPQKISIRKVYQGIDFLGYSVFPRHRLVRTTTRRRIVIKIKRRIDEYRNKKISRDALAQSLQSYLGVLSHANAYNLSEDLKNFLWFEK